MIRATTAAAPAPLPAFPFRWDAETEILSGRQDLSDAPAGFTGSWEIESPTGAVVVLETTGGVPGGIEVVAWPDVERAALTVPHAAAPGRVILEALIRLKFGTPPARSVRIAENVIVDLDAAGCLGGLWLDALPPFEQGE
ncbi:MAG TPA: hypothetical protein VGA02_14175 [Gemmatimonadales bacterium]|jgi:hypothetical protein